jgi:radical SAM protein with 4Fe4S-binding SPASM domain
MFARWNRSCLGCIDQPSDDQTTWFRIPIAGWVLPPEKFSSVLVVKDGNDSELIPIGSDNRPDVASNFPAIRDAGKGGFKGVITLGEREGQHLISIFAVTTDGNKILLGKRTVINSRSQIYNGPEFFQLGLTNKCNLSCAMCPAHSSSSLWAGDGISINPLLLEKSLESLRFYATNIKRVFMNEYGEPFLYPEIFNVIKEIHQICPHAKISLGSNGTLFSKDLIQKIIDSSLTEIAISLDAGSEKTYNKIRIGADFQEVRTGIKRFLESRKKAGKIKPEIHTNFVLMHSNIQDLPDYVRLAVNLGVDHIQTINPFGIFTGDIGECLYSMPGERGIPRIENYRTIIEEAELIAQKAGIPFSLPPFYPSGPGTDCRGRGRTRVYISPSGDVYHCCIMAAKGPEKGSAIAAFGNLRDHSLQEIWESEQYTHFREAFFRGDIPHPFCEYCSRYYHL